MNQRQIKFRVWDKKDEIMFYPYFLSINDDGVVLQYNKTDIFQPYKNEHILLQFTGLYDKNGKEIWEGDVLKDDEQEEFSVIRFGEITIEDRGHIGFYHKILRGNLLKFVQL